MVSCCRLLDAALKDAEQKYKQELKRLSSVLAETEERLKGKNHAVL